MGKGVAGERRARRDGRDAARRGAAALRVHTHAVASVFESKRRRARTSLALGGSHDETTTRLHDDAPKASSKVPSKRRRRRGGVVAGHRSGVVEGRVGVVEGLLASSIGVRRRRARRATHTSETETSTCGRSGAKSAAVTLPRWPSSRAKRAPSSPPPPPPPPPSAACVGGWHTLFHRLPGVNMTGGSVTSAHVAAPPRHALM